MHTIDHFVETATRQFTDRLKPRSLFEESIKNLSQTKCISYYGIGGIGKTRLLSKLSKKQKFMHLIKGSGGGGHTSDDYKTYTGITTIGVIHDGATKLYIEPIAIASLEYGRGHKKIPLDTIVVDLVAK